MFIKNIRLLVLLIVMLCLIAVVAAPVSAQFYETIEWEIFEMVNQERTSRGLPAYLMDSKLRQMARDHSKDMGDNRFYNHTSPTTGTFADRATAAGLTGSSGENITKFPWGSAYAAMYGETRFANGVNFTIEGWRDSTTGHWEKIISSAFKYIGIGVYQSSDGQYSYTQVFNGASSPPGTILQPPASAQHGSLQVTIEPAGARSAGAQWRVTSGPDTNWKNSGATLSNLPVGTYTVTFKSVSGWNAPPNSTVNVTANQTQVGTVTYTPETTQKWDKYFDLSTRAITFDGGILAASFNSYGTYLRYSSGQWHQLTPATAIALAYHSNVLFASFDGFGTFRFSNNQWQQLTPATARALTYHNNVLYASFDGFGTWRFSNNQWQASTPATARALAYHNNVLYASFDGYGTFYWSSNQWHQVTNVSAHALAYQNGIVAAVFSGHGLYFYQNGTFYGVTKDVANALAFGDINQNGKTDLLCSFPSLNAMWYTQVDVWLSP